MSFYLITGATSGIGLATANRLLAQCDKVIALCRNLEKVNACFGEHLHQGNVIALQWDFSDNDGLYEFCLKELASYRIIGFLHCAGDTLMKRLLKVSYKEMHNLFEVHFFAFVEITRALLKLRAKDQELSIIAFSSNCVYCNFHAVRMYSCVKNAIAYYIDSISREVMKLYGNKNRFNVTDRELLETDDSDNADDIDKNHLVVASKQGLMVRINALAPDMVDTPMTYFYKDGIARGEVKGQIIPLEKFVDMIFSVMNNRYITGQVLVVNNGMFGD